MAIYSDEKRPALAKLIKYLLFVNVVFFIILVLFWILRAGPEGGLAYTGTYATILIGLNVFAFLIYEQLFRPDDDFWRRTAEAMGSLQVVASCVALLIVIGTIALAISPGLGGILPVAAGTQPVATAVTTSTVAAVSQVEVTPTECYRTSTGCISYPPVATIPPPGAPLSQNDPIVGSFTFDKAQFDPKQNYNSRAGTYEYRSLVVPLDHSPDIKWTFRDDGVVLFYESSTGTLLRTGTWTKTDLGNGKSEYRIKRGNFDYRGTFENNAFRITVPDFWNMTKIE